MIPDYGDMPDEDRMRCVSVVHTIAANVTNPGLSDANFREMVQNSLRTIPSASHVLDKYKRTHDLYQDEGEGLFVSFASQQGGAVLISYATLRHCFKPFDIRKINATETYTPEQYATMFSHVRENTQGTLVETSHQFMLICAQAILSGEAINFSLV